MRFGSRLEEENWNYYIGKTLEYWNGPLPPEDHPAYEESIKNVQRLFQQYNISAEVVDQFVNALIGKPFSWGLKDKDGFTSNEAEKIISDWFEWQTEVAIDTDLGDPIASAVTQMLVRDSGSGSGVGYLRLYSPDIYAELEPYQRVIYHAPAPGTVSAQRNLDGVLYKVEYTYGEGDTESYELLPNGNTRRINEKLGIEEELDYGGRLPIVELKGRAIINEAIKQGQNSINKTLTIKNINIETAGYLERIFTNALPPGKFIQNAEGEIVYEESPEGLDVGPGRNVYVNGLQVGEFGNPTNIKDPKVIFREPVPVQAFREGIEMDTAVIYFQAGLAYLLSSGDGKISGKSRLTLKEDFLIRLRVYERIVEAAIRKLLTIVMKILESDYPVLAGYKPVVELNLAVSPLPEERQQNREDFKVGALSLPSLISANGKDAQKEIALIEEHAEIVGKIQSLFTDPNSNRETMAEDRVNDRIREAGREI